MKKIGILLTTPAVEEAVYQRIQTPLEAKFEIHKITNDRILEAINQKDDKTVERLTKDAIDEFKKTQ